MMSLCPASAAIPGGLWTPGAGTPPGPDFKRASEGSAGLRSTGAKAVALDSGSSSLSSAVE